MRVRSKKIFGQWVYDTIYLIFTLHWMSLECGGGVITAMSRATINLPGPVSRLSKLWAPAHHRYVFLLLSVTVLLFRNCPELNIINIANDPGISDYVGTLSGYCWKSGYVKFYVLIFCCRVCIFFDRKRVYWQEAHSMVTPLMNSTIGGLVNDLLTF